MSESKSRLRNQYTKALVLVELGAIRRSITSDRWITTPCDQEPMPGSTDLLDAINAEGYCCVGVSNQSGVGFGYKSLESAIAEHIISMHLFPQLALIMFCPDFRGKSAFCCTHEDARQVPAASQLTGLYRMPRPGMAMHAAACLGARPVAAIGVSKSMRGAAQELGVAWIEADDALRDPSSVALALIGQETDHAA